MPAKRKALKKAGPKSAKKTVRAAAKSSSTLGFEKLSYLLLALAVVAVGFFSLPNYNMLLPGAASLLGLPTRWLLFLGFAALVALWRLVPQVSESQWDFSPWIARVCFWLLMGLGIYMRVENPTKPVGCFWDDNYIHTSDIRNIIDYHEFLFLFPSGWREPLFPYLTALLWVLFPQANGVVIVLISNTVIDVSVLWVCYLLGKQVGGRRMGILLLAMGALCKPMITMCKLGYATDTAVLACGVALLFFFRLLKKTDWLHFVEWGAALGFGAFCYVPFRPWTPVMLGAVWLYVFSDPKERRFDFYRAVLGPGLLAAWAFLFLYKNSFLPENNGLINLVTSLPCLLVVAAILAVSYYQTFQKERKKGFSKLFGWASGALVTALVMAPFYLHPHYSSHTSDISIFSKIYTPDPKQIWPKFWSNVWFAFVMSFGMTNDVAHIPALGDSFFDFYVALSSLLGLAYFAARPSWPKAYLAALYIVGLVPFVFSNAPHSARLEAVVMPLLLAGAWGLNRLWVAALQVRASREMNILCAAFLVAFLLVEFNWNTRLVHEWVDNKITGVLVDDQTNKELPDHRVYLFEYNPGFYTCATDILSDGKDVFQSMGSNAIDLTTDEKGKDLALMVYGEDKNVQQQLEALFPGIPWQKRSNHWQTPQENPCLWYMEVPFDRIPVADSGLFHVQRVSPWTWRRRCYGRYGLGRGLILYEDRVAHWNDSLPPAQYIDWNNSMRVVGDWNVKAEGDYTFTVHTANVLWFLLDGCKVMKVEPGEGLVTRTYKTRLTPGVHHVELVTAFTWEHRVPAITVMAPDHPAEMALDDYAALSAPQTPQNAQ